MSIHAALALNSDAKARDTLTASQKFQNTTGSNQWISVNYLLFR